MELTPIEPGQVVNIPLAQIEPDPEQPRRYFEEEALDALALDIKARGVQEPIKIRRSVIAGDPYIIKTGERRYQASRRAGKRQIPCILAEPESLANKARSLERLFDQIAENELREPLSALDWAYSFRRMREKHGMKVNEIAEACAARGLKFSRPHVSNIMRLAELPDWAQAALRDRRLTAGHGKVLFSALDSPKVEEEIRAIIDDVDRPDPPSVRELQRQIADAYFRAHTTAWALRDDEAYAELKQRPKDIGVVEVAVPGREQPVFFVVDPERYEAAIEARDEELEREADDDSDDVSEAAATRSARDSAPPERLPSANPNWTPQTGAVNTYTRQHKIERSLEVWLAREIEARFDSADRLRLGAWLAYSLQSRSDDHDETLWAFSDSLPEDPPAAPLTWDAWRAQGTDAVLALLEAAGERLVQVAGLPLLLELAGSPRPDINDYRCNAAWFESLDRDDLDLALDRLSDVVPPSDIPDEFEARVALLVQHAELFGVPAAIVDAWVALTAEESTS